MPEDELHLRGDVALDLGHAYCSVGDFESASEAFARAAAIGRAADDLRTALFALHYQASLEISRGHLLKAERLLLDGKRLAEGRPEGVPSVAGIIDVGMGDLLLPARRAGRVETALGRGDRARQTERRGEDPGLRLRQPRPRAHGPWRRRNGALAHAAGRRAHTEVAAHLGVAGAVLAGAGRRGVGGALGAGSTGRPKTTSATRATSSASRWPACCSRRAGPTRPSIPSEGLLAERAVRGTEGARDRAARVARARLRTVAARPGGRWTI